MQTLARLDRARFAALADAALAQTAKALGSRGGDFLSPASVRNMVVALADPIGTVYNPATGAGQLLIETATKSAARRSLKLVGQEIDARIWAISQLNLMLHDVDADIALGDVFTEDRHPDLRADRIVSVPPWNQRFPAAAVLRDDPRWVWGEPGPSDGNAAWIQHCLAHLAEDGRAVIVLPNGALFERGRSGRIRQRIMKAGLLEAVVALPAGLFPWTQIPCAILVLRKRRVHEVASLYARWVDGFPPDRDYAAVATYGELAANDFVIDPGRYLSLPIISVDRKVAEERRRALEHRLEALTRESHDADNRLRAVLGRGR